MKMRKRIAALIAVAMIAALMPMSTFAASKNKVTKVVTVKKDAKLEKPAAPDLKIDLTDDGLPTNQAFYLNLTGAEWGTPADLVTALPMGAAIENAAGTTEEKNTINFDFLTYQFVAYRESDTVLEIKHKGVGNNNASFNDELIFPLVMSKVSGAEAFVEIEKYDTEVSETKHLFAVTDGAKANVTVGTVPSLYRRVEMAKITLEERYAEAFVGADREFTIELRDTDFEFSTSALSTLKGLRAYRNQSGIVAYGTTKGKEDRTKLVVTLPAGLTNPTSQRGLFEVVGVDVVAAKDSRMGEVKATISSSSDGIVAKETIIVAKRADYNTVLAVAEDWEYEVVAGNEKEIKFTLSEELANSLVGTRPVTFTFTNGVKIKGEYTTTGTTTTLDPITADVINVNGSDDVELADRGDWDDTRILDRVYVSTDRTSFTVDRFELEQDKKGSYAFTTTILIPAGVTGEVVLKAEGKGIDEQEIIVAKVEAPAEVESTKMDIKVGLKEIETTGKIIIKETKEDRFDQGKDIVLRVDDIDAGLRIKSFKAKVVEGDLVLADDPYENTDWSGEAIGIKRASTEVSTIEITDIVMYTDRTVPEGTYDLFVGGDAISRITDRADLEFVKVGNHDMDPVVTVKDFINITTKNTEDISGSANKAKVAFVVGSTEYLVNGKVQEMDVAPYIKDGRTMVPVRYVAAALGVKPEQVIWDGANQTATVIADKIIQVKLGSKMMLVNGVSFPMTAAAELTADRTFVPVAEMARALGVPVNWAPENATATFN